MARNDNNPIIVERSRGGAVTVIALIVLGVLVAIAGFLLMERENRSEDAVATAAQQVGDAAQDVGDAARDATEGK